MASGDTPITLVGNLVADPELRYTPSGTAVANFRVASTPRRFDAQSNQWVDGESLFLTCNVWRQTAENVANSLRKGERVIVQGRLKQRTYDTRDGERRVVFEVEVDEVGPSLKWATSQVTKTPRQGGWNNGAASSYGGDNGGHQGYGNRTAGSPSAGDPGAYRGNEQRGQRTHYLDDDPWRSAPSGASVQAGTDEPPF